MESDQVACLADGGHDSWEAQLSKSALTGKSTDTQGVLDLQPLA